ncbi:MAG: hypothetical protein U0401_00105 [Anaerolineae bacterium]
MLPNFMALLTELGRELGDDQLTADPMSGPKSVLIAGLRVGAAAD